MRAALSPVLDRSAAALARVGVRPMALTVAGLVLALLAAVAAAMTLWMAALGLWLASRVADGLDGPLARTTKRVSPFGGWADISADLGAYGAFIAGCAVGNPQATTACLVLLVLYYVNGGSLLALSAAASQRGVARSDERTFHFPRGLAEGTETIVVHSLMALMPAWIPGLAWGFAAMVAVTIGQRVVLAARILR